MPVQGCTLLFIQATEQLTGFVGDPLFYLRQAIPQQKPKLKVAEYSSEINITLLKVNKGKSVPLQAWSGPEGSRKLRFSDFMTMAQGGGKVVSLMHRLPVRR